MDALRSALKRPELGPGLAFVALLGVLASSDGGFPATTWYPAAIFLLGLLALLVWFLRARLGELSRPTWAAIGLLGAFALWSFASIVWAGVPWIAWESSNRVVLYLIVFAAFALLPWRGGSAAIVLGAYSVVIAAVGVVAVAGAAGDGAAAGAVIDGRFADPVGYPNGTAALFAMGFWPAALLASRREVPPAARALMLATAGLLLQLAMLPQSRGAIVAFPIALAIFVALAPRRISLLIALVPVAIATALAAGPILDVFRAGEDGLPVGPAVSDALGAMAVSFVALLLAGGMIAITDANTRLSQERERMLVRATAVAGAAVGVVAVIAALIAVGNPASWAEDRWDDFKGGYASTDFSESRLTGGLGSNRYDFWRVGLAEEFADSPLVGQGSDNFAVGYVEHRESEEEPLYPHSLPIRVLAGTGVVGLLLVVAAAVAGLAAVARTRWRATEPMPRAVAAAALGSTAYFAVHAAGDWIWSFPAIAMPAFAWMGMAAGMSPLRRSVGDVRAANWGRARLRLVTTAAVAAAVLVAVSFALPWLAARETAIAATTWEDDPEAAFSRLDRARDLNPISSQPDLTAGSIASQLGDRERMRESFANALERDPDNWYATLELGVVEALAGERASALEHLERAHELNPRDELIGEALRGARRGRPISTERVDRALLARVCSIVGPTEDTRYCK